MDNLLTQPNSWLSILGTVALLLTGNLANKYLVPFLKVGKRQKYAGYIAQIADEVTDDLRGKYPDNQWLKHIDEAVDQLVTICGVSPDIARRAIGAAATRKTVK